MIKNSVHPKCPIHLHILLEYFRCVFRFTPGQQPYLILQRIISGSHCLHRFHQQLGPRVHQLIVQLPGRHVRLNLHPLLENQIPGINLVFQKKSRHPATSLPVHHRPVDRGRPPVIRQQRSVQINRSQRGHIPNHLRQHLECHHELQIRLKSPQLL